MISSDDTVECLITQYAHIALHHMVALALWIAYLTDSNVKVVWGDASHSRALGIGLLVGLTYAFLKDIRKAQQILFTSGQNDTLLVPDASRDLASTNRWTAQGHTPHLQETNPGLIGFNNSFFIPLCYERDTGYFPSAAVVPLPLPKCAPASAAARCTENFSDLEPADFMSP